MFFPAEPKLGEVLTLWSLQVFRGRSGAGAAYQHHSLQLVLGFSLLYVWRLQMLLFQCVPRDRRFSLHPSDCFGGENILSHDEEILLGVSIIFFLPFLPLSPLGYK